ncbi:MAG TPA: hypothetical protein VKG01_16095 [Thermoanaerobaculia bacterium]|nr:hypothetical protein [Thermoanaerobaculia bacterium]
MSSQRPARSVGLWIALLLLLAGSARGQEKKPPPGFTEKVEVNVRTILVIVTDEKGKPVEKPLTPEDVVVLEDGVPAKVLGVDRVRSLKGTESGGAKPPSPSEPPAAAPNAPIERVRQVLYLDASLLRKQSVKKVCEIFAKNLDPMLARGPLEIVLADPEPRSVLASTDQAAEVRETLASLARKAYGRDRLYDVRTDFVPGASAKSAMGSESDKLSRTMRAKAAMQEEVQLVRQSFEALQRWAAARLDRNPAVLYLANDGFDLVLSDFYRNYLTYPDGGQAQTQAEQVRMQFDPQIPALVAQAETALANQGLMTIPLAIGGTESFFAGSPSVTSKRPLADMRNPVSDSPTFLFVRPLEPLRQVAAATGGEVVTREAVLLEALDRLSNAVAITYRMERPPDGLLHRLEVKSRREGVLLRASRSVTSGTAELTAAAQKTLKVLGEPPPRQASGLPVVARVELTEVKKNGRRVGVLQVSAELAEVSAALAKVGPGRIRITLAVQATGSKPFVHHDEMDLRDDDPGTSWLYEAPFEWPPEAQKVAVTVEELKTGTQGAAIAELPKPE